jgi:hypothetical protein
MKRLVIAIVMLFSVSAVVFANNILPLNVAQTVAQDDKEKIDPAQLPEPVKKALESEDFSGWMINAAYIVKSTSTYEVELSNGTETQTVKFDKDGNVIESAKKKQ